MTSPIKRVTPCPVPFSDHIYKTIQKVDVPLRIWPATAGEGKRPWLLWMHGGGFTAGKHVIPNAWVVPAFRQYNYHVVSIGYRFAPHVGLSEIMDDCKDALAWLRINLSDIVGEDKLDVERYVVGGDSAGGTLSALCGHFLNPTPRAVIDVFGVVDPIDPFFHDVEAAAALAPYFKPSGKWPDAVIEAALAERDPSKAEVIAPWTWELEPEMSVEDLRTFWGMPEFTPSDKDLLRMEMVKVSSKQKKLFQTLLRRERFETNEEFMTELKNWSSIELLDRTASYPPTFFLHGVADRAVPVDQSYKMAAKLKEKGVPVGEAYHPTGDHCFENTIEGPDADGWTEYIVPCMEFIDKYTKA